MTTLTKCLGATVLSLGLFLGVGVLVVGATSTEVLQPAGTITYNENLAVNAGGQFNWLQVGKQNKGGVMYFNGTILNNTTNKSGANNPVTFGDNVRIDGEIYRTEIGGDNPLKLSDTVNPTTTNTYALGSANNRWSDVYAKDANFSGTTTIAALSGAGIVTATNLASDSVTTEKIANEAVKSENIKNGTIVEADLADNAITSAKISAGAIDNSELASDAVTSDKIASDAITSADIASSAIVTEKIADGSVTNDQLANNAVRTNNIDFNVVTAQKMDYSSSHGYAKAGGSIDSNGDILFSFNNVGGSFTVNHVGSGLYDISVQGVSTSDMAIASIYGSDKGCVSAIVSNPGQVSILTYNLTDPGSSADHKFNFVVY
jgi:hypothetical protein